jgi:hypothetical protein
MDKTAREKQQTKLPSPDGLPSRCLAPPSICISSQKPDAPFQPPPFATHNASKHQSVRKMFCCSQSTTLMTNAPFQVFLSK